MRVSNAYHKQKHNATMLDIQYHSTTFGFPLPGSNLFPIFIQYERGTFAWIRNYICVVIMGEIWCQYIIFRLLLLV